MDIWGCSFFNVHYQDTRSFLKAIGMRLSPVKRMPTEMVVRKGVNRALNNISGGYPVIFKYISYKLHDMPSNLFTVLLN